MLSLVELERAARALQAAVGGHRVQAIGQPDPSTVVLTAYGGEGEARGRRHVLLCCAPERARVSLLPAAGASLPTPPAFSQYLRAHVMNARIGACRVEGGDRQLAVGLETREGELELWLTLFGRRSNLLLLDAERRILAALRPLAETRPELELGGVWQAPAAGPPRAGEDRFAEVPDDALLAAIEAHYAPLASRGEAESLARRLETALRKELRGLDRKLEKLARELADAEAATDCERQGNLLKGVLGTLRKGDTEAEVTDHATGETLRVALDPTRTPSENLEALFKRYRKAVRTLTKGGAQQQAVAEQREHLAALAAELESLPVDESDEAGEALAAFAARPEVAALVSRHAPAERPAAPRPGAPSEVTLAGRTFPRRLAPRRYPTAGGMEIWVGRSDAGNDFLSTRLARGKDLFFHLDGAPGSHVILRTGGRSDPPSEALLDACELAVHYSKAKNATRADVHVVPIKNVKKPKGAKPGLVMVHGGRSVHLRRTPARLQRLLEAKLED